MDIGQTDGHAAHSITTLAKLALWCAVIKIINKSSRLNFNKSSSGDEIPERDVTYHLFCLLIYH